MNLLMVYGAGGTKDHFSACREIFEREGIKTFVPSLSGFEGKPMSQSGGAFDKFLADIWETIAPNRDGEWTLYGHGFGAALILELASRNFEFPNGNEVQPDKLILHSFTGPASVNGPLSGIFSSGIFRKSRISRLNILKSSFFEPDNIEPDAKERFLNGFEACSCLDVIAEMISDEWYENRKYKIEDANLHFLMGENEAGAASKYLMKLKGDFPNSKIDLVKQWPLYPMMEFPAEFAGHLLKNHLLAGKG